MADSRDKKAQERAERRKLFLEWDIESTLPKQVGNFHLSRTDRQEERLYHAFQWEDHNTGWIVEALFDEETMDYMVKADFRLFSMTEIETIADVAKFENFKAFVAKLTPGWIRRTMIDRPVSILIRGKGFHAWDYKPFLPSKIGHFHLSITPDKPVHGLNGSYIFAAYEYREENTGLLFFYNMYRQEYYGELRARTIPGIIHQYDAKTLAELEKKLTVYLKKDLRLVREHPEWMEDTYKLDPTIERPGGAADSDRKTRWANEIEEGIAFDCLTKCYDA